jgi:Helicase conserved C-terminal domain
MPNLWTLLEPVQDHFRRIASAPAQQQLQCQPADVIALARAVPQATIVMCHVGGVLGYGAYAGKKDEVHAVWRANMEIAELGRRAGLAQAVEETVSEVKLAKLHSLLESEGFFADPDQRLLIFTEFRDTLDYILSKSAVWGLKAGSIHGSMNIGARDIPGTRLYAEQQFKDGDIQVLVATEAAGEGINLQFCHFVINYDIPWNPNRLEQRMGRIHRYGQRHDCLIFNFVATNTVEGRVLERLLQKLQEIRDALDDDAVFNVVGEVMPAAYVARTLVHPHWSKSDPVPRSCRMTGLRCEPVFRNFFKNTPETLVSRQTQCSICVYERHPPQSSHAAIDKSRACSSSRRNSGCGARHMVRYVSRKGSQI